MRSVGEGPAVARTARRSVERWALLVPHRERLVRLASARLGDVHEAQDCVHEAMLRALDFDGLDENRVAAFLSTVTIRLCVDRHRACARDRRIIHRLWEPGCEEGPEERICDRLLGAWLLGLIVALPTRERSVLQARADGLSTSEAARELGITPKAAESAFTRARTKMLVHAAAAA